MSDMTFQILEIAVSIMSALVAAYLIPFIKAKTSEAKNTDIMGMIDVAVKAAEQTIRESGQGKAKKAEVVAFLKVWLSDNKIFLTDDQLDRLIEAAVYQLKQEG